MAGTSKGDNTPYPLGRRIMLLVLGWSLLITIITTGVQIQLEYNREFAMLNKRLAQIEVVEVPSISNSLWHFDKTQIQLQLQGILNLEDVRYVELQIDNDAIYTAGNAFSENDAISRAFSIDYTQDQVIFPLGKLLVMADRNLLQMRVMGLLTRILITSAVQTFLQAALILYIVNKLLTHPLNQIVQYAENLSLEHLDSPLVLKRRIFSPPNDELQNLATRLNEMRSRLNEDIKIREQAEALLIEQHETLITQQQALEEAETETRQLNVELEKRVDERTRQLAALNQELEAFSHSVAHDLRAPLRHMYGFSQVLFDDYENQFPEDAKPLLKRIQEAVQRMTQMVDALLELTKVARGDLQISKIPLSEVVKSISDELHTREPSRNVLVTIQPDLTLHADPRLLQILLENLFSNAWKFTTRHPSAKIEFGCLPESQNGKVFFIRDNGAGFDITAANRLFIPFQRLHTDADFSGTGIGLATVYRIVQRHGGKIWAESEVDRGATFYFTLPDHPDFQHQA
jgi:signal transduction histidine kinase